MQNRCKMQSHDIQPLFVFNKILPTEEHYQQPIRQISPSIKINDQITLLEFNQSKEKFIQFLKTLDEQRKSQIRYDVLQHCQQLNQKKKIIPSYLSPETIFRLINCRIEKMIKNKKIKKNWSEEDLKILVWIVSKYSDKHKIKNLQKDLTFEDWTNMSKLIPGLTPNCCLFKWLSLKKVHLSTYSWEQEEEQLLQLIVKSRYQREIELKRGSAINWKWVSQQLFQKNQNKQKVFRNAKQCRQHWNCFLNPELKKGAWQIEEDIKLLSIVKSNHGMKRWSTIVQEFAGRTQNSIKNRFTLLLEKQAKITKIKNELVLIDACLQSYSTLQQANHERAKLFIPVVKSHSTVVNSEPTTIVDEKPSAKVKQQSHDNHPMPLKAQDTSTIKIQYVKISKKQQLLEILRYHEMKKCCFPADAFPSKE